MLDPRDWKVAVVLSSILLLEKDKAQVQADFWLHYHEGPAAGSELVVHAVERCMIEFKLLV